MGNSSLTTGEKKQLRDHETTIERGLNSFVEVGNALVAIRDGKLYTDIGDTFEAYCKKRWQFGKAYAYRLIDAAQVVDNLSPIGDIEPPKTEAVARVLASVPDENKQADVWVKANETAPKDKAGKPKVTAAHVRKVAEEIAPAPPKPDKPKSEPEAKPAKGKPVIDLRKFSDLESHLGKAIRMNTDIKDHCGGAEYHEKIRVKLYEAVKVLETWRKHSGAA